MSAFNLGQRVRIVSADAHPEAVGLEATITSLSAWSWLNGCPMIEIRADNGKTYLAFSRNIEPIVPPHSWEAIRALENLPEWNCPLPVEVRAA